MSEQTDTIEAVARAIRVEIDRYWRDDTLEPDDLALGRVAIASHTKALIEQAGEIEKRLEDHARAVGGDDSFERLYGSEAVQAAAIIAALQAQLATARIEGVRAGIEAAAREADEHARQAWVIGDREGQSSVCSSGRNYGARAVGQTIRALDAAAIARSNGPIQRTARHCNHRPVVTRGRDANRSDPQ